MLVTTFIVYGIAYILIGFIIAVIFTTVSGYDEMKKRNWPLFKPEQQAYVHIFLGLQFLWIIIVPYAVIGTLGEQIVDYALTLGANIYKTNNSNKN